MTEHKLPVRQLIILSICRLAEPIALTSVFPYLPEMMESFGIPKNDIARWAGVTSAMLPICQACTGLLWGAASDRYGRKPIILLSLFNTMCFMLLLGLSTSLPMALAARALEGLGNGNVGVLRTTVAELCPWKELQPRAFSIMPLVYTVGAIIGPTLGGALANPLRVDPRKPRGDAFLEHFPYILPNIVAAAFFMVGITVGWLFLKETLETKKHRPDLGRRTGMMLTAFLRKTLGKANAEQEPLLHRQKAANEEREQRQRMASDNIKKGSPGIRDVLTYQTSLILVIYTILAFFTLAYDQLLPVFMHHPPQSLEDPNVKLPLKFAGGFGLDSQRIGVIFTIFAMSSTMWQFLFFPTIARYLGILRCLRIALLIFPFVFFATPFLGLIPDPAIRQVAVVVVLMIRGVGGTFAFPTTTIMLTNSASSLRNLGRLNGLATSIAALGFAAGPAVGGALFSWGVKRGYILVPFWTLCVVSLVASIPACWLVEGKGFGEDSDPDLDEEDSDAHLQHDEERGIDEYSRESNESESEFGEPANLLSYTSTRSSIAMLSDDGTENDEGESHGRRLSSSALVTGRSQSLGMSKRTVRKQSSVPIGMGVGFRRYSSNLGSTGIGAGGANWGAA